MKRICSLLLSICLVFGLCACGQDIQKAWQEQYDLGMRYLSEGNYEEAVIAFTAAIEIDPKKVETYKKAAEAYELMADYKSAKDILEKGYKETGDKSLQKEYQNIEERGLGEVADTREWALKSPLKPQELTIGKIPFYQTNVYAAKEAYPNKMYSSDIGIEIGTDGVTYSVWKEVDGKKYGGMMDLYQSSGSDTITQVIYQRIEEVGDLEEQFHTEFRNISMGSSFEDVLSLVGFTDEGIRYILKTAEEGSVFGDEYTRTQWDEEKILALYDDGDLPNVYWYPYEGGEDPDELELVFEWRYSDTNEIGNQGVRLYLRFRDDVLDFIDLSVM